MLPVELFTEIERLGSSFWRRTSWTDSSIPDIVITFPYLHFFFIKQGLLESKFISKGSSQMGGMNGDPPS